MEFQYAPGLPGYGTQGADGSDGLLGMGFYYSEYSGDTDTTTITSKISSNKILSSVDAYISGYPDRVYQTGDIFIDVNGKAFTIDISGAYADLYYDTGTRLNTSTIFIEGADTDHTPIYTRYSNAFTSDKFLLDTVYAADGPNNYALAPASTDGLYGIGAKDFARINYVDNSVGQNDTFYEPFVIYTNTNDTGTPEKSIGLVKEYNVDNWRFGNNTNAGVLRDVSLIFDFANIYARGGINVDGSTILDEGVVVTGEIVQSGDVVKIGGETTISNDLYVSTDLYALEDASVGGDLRVIGDIDIEGGTITFFDVASTINVNGGQSLMVTTSNPTSTGGDIVIFCSSGQAGSNGGNATLQAGSGVPTTTGGGDGGIVSLTSGTGGNVTVSGPGTGGDLNISSGDGGDNTQPADGGNAGNISIIAGDGGTGSIASYSGYGGNITIRSGSSDSGGNDGGDVSIGTGEGSNSGNVYITTALDGLGNAGDIKIIAGQGADDNTGFFDIDAYRTDINGLLYLPEVATGISAIARYGLQIDGAGLVTGGVTGTSDIRLKTIDSSIVNVLQSLNNLSTIKFKFNELGKEILSADPNLIDYGLIAQEVEKDFPEVVGEFEAKDGNNYKLIDYIKFIPILVSAINEQQETIKSLLDRVTALENA